MRAAARVGRYQGSRQKALPVSIPAGTEGINASAPLARMNPQECIFSYNMLPTDFGMVTRKGYSEHANGWTGGYAKTVIPFEGNTVSDSKLFVANPSGIWDVSTAGETSPTQVVTFSTTTGNAGICSFIQFSTDGDEQYILLCDGANGYYVYTQSTDTWAKIAQGAGATQIDNVDPATFDFVMVWKKRVWFIQRDKGSAWYLSPGALYGAATEFNFSDQFRFGGVLCSLHNWTLDGGDGIDDKLVAISRGGDVCVYQGTDPAAVSTFELRGTWYVGEVPEGRRFASEHSGELYILSKRGLSAMSRVVNGVTSEESRLTHKIDPYIRPVLDEELDDFGWDVHVDQTQDLLTVNSPPRTNVEQQNFVMYLGRGSWGIARGLPMAHSVNWRGEVYWCDNVLSKIYKKTGYVDQVYLDAATDGDPVAIDWQVLSAYHDFGEENGARFKRIPFIRPMFSGEGGAPAFNVNAYFDYDLSEITSPPTLTGSSESAWDSGAFDTALWGGSIEASDRPKGGSGIGRHVAVNIRGRTSDLTTLIGFDLTVELGGLL